MSTPIVFISISAPVVFWHSPVLTIFNFFLWTHQMIRSWSLKGNFEDAVVTVCISICKSANQGSAANDIVLLFPIPLESRTWDNITSSLKLATFDMKHTQSLVHSPRSQEERLNHLSETAAVTSPHIHRRNCNTNTERTRHLKLTSSFTSL